MTDDQIIHDVLDTLNNWDKDNRDTTMSIPFFIKEKFNLEERKCFDLTRQMVKAGLVYRFRDNDYLITDKGRQIADTTGGWLNQPKTNHNPFLLRPSLTPTTTIINNSPKKNENEHRYITVLKENIKKFWWAIFIPLLLAYASHYMEYNWFIPKQNQETPTDKTTNPV